MHIYERTYEEAGGEAVEVRFFYTVSWGCPEVPPSMKNETGSPYEPPELEITGIQAANPVSEGPMKWATVINEYYDRLVTWAEGFEDEMLEKAREDLLDDRY